MEMGCESDEPRVASYLADDEAYVPLNELRSPPRIRRLQDRQRKRYGVSHSDNYISSSDDESSVDSSIMDLACHQTLQQTASSELRSPFWKIQQLPSTSTSQQQSPPPLSSSSSSGPNNYSGITEYRRRLEIIKERRQRQISRSSEHTSQLYLLPQEHEIESNLINRPILYGHQRRPSATVDEVFELLQEACQSFDEITIDTTRTMDSTTNICQNSSSDHQLPISPPGISSGQGRKGNVSNNKNAFNIRRLMCTSSQKKIDTSFEQIKDTICNTTATLTSTSTVNDDVDRHDSEMTKGNGTSDDNEHTAVDGDFPGILASSTIPSMNAPDNGSLDRTLCTEPLSPNVKQTESSLPKARSSSSLFSFQADTKLDNEDEDKDNMNLHDETSNISSIYHAAGSPSRSRGFFRPRSRGKAYNIVMDSDDQNSQQQQKQHQQITTEVDTISSISRRNSSSSFSWFRKDPWYVRPANAREGGGDGGDDEIRANEYGNTKNEVLDRMMHAVVYVTEK